MLNSQTSNPLYHYCSVETFFNIISSKKIRLSSTNTMNDALDGRWLYHHLEILGHNHRFREELGPEENAKREKLRRLHFYSDQFRNMNTFYSFSLSEEGDLLSQWRGYANDGAGISIGFNVSNLAASMNPNETLKTSTFSFYKMKYPSQKQILIAIENAFAKHCPNPELEPLDYGKFTEFIDTMNTEVKNSAFSEEKEWRFITRRGNANVFSPTLFPDTPRANFMVRDGRITSFYEFEFKTLFGIDQPIIEIVLGPKCKIDRTELNLFLNLNSISCAVNSSEATYR